MKQVVKKEHISEAELIKRGWNKNVISLYLKPEKNKLQPPRPTCSTCNHINLECDSNTYGGFLCKNLNALNADGKAASTSGGYNIRIKDIKNFGCNQHSDFEVK